MRDAVELVAHSRVDVRVAVAVDVAPQRGDAVDVGVAVGVVTVAPLIIGLSAAMRDPPPRSEQIEGAAGLLALAAMTGIVITLPEQLWETVVPERCCSPCCCGSPPVVDLSSPRGEC